MRGHVTTRRRGGDPSYRTTAHPHGTRKGVLRNLHNRLIHNRLIHNRLIHNRLSYPQQHEEGPGTGLLLGFADRSGAERFARVYRTPRQPETCARRRALSPRQPRDPRPPTTTITTSGSSNINSGKSSDSCKLQQQRSPRPAGSPARRGARRHTLVAKLLHEQQPPVRVPAHHLCARTQGREIRSLIPKK
jgi:hypothetical protein